MLFIVFRSLVVSVLVAGALAGGAPAGRPGAVQSTPLPAHARPCSRSRVATGPRPNPPCHRLSYRTSRPFPATGQMVSGDFTTYWERNGGLAQQGYPTSPVIEEVSELEGQRYQVQYVERAGFERHPENLRF